MDLKNKKIDQDEFFKQREDVLKQWKTGAEVNLEEASEYVRNIPEEKNFAKKLEKAKNEGKTLAQPRAGVALIDEHITLLNFLDK